MNLLMLAVVSFASCTECPQETRDFLNIPSNVKCEVIKWKLDMWDNGTYNLSAQWSYYPDNRTLKEQGSIVDSKGVWKKDGDVYTLTSNDKTLNLLKLNDNIFQILGTSKKILKGGEGYANTLNRVDPVPDKTIDFEFPNKPDPTLREMILTGRTPLIPFDKLLEITDKEDHDKIKWLIKFHADGTLDVRKILEQPADYKGTWSVSGNIYKLDFDKHTLYLLRGSDDVYYFMTKEDGLLVGNNEFGMSLIRRSPSGR